MTTPADVRAALGLKTDAHDELIALAIVSVEFSAPADASPERVARMVARVVADYPEIERELYREGVYG